MMKGEKVFCPVLLDPTNYTPDTFDLLENEEAAKYWLPCMEEMIFKFITRVSFLNPDDKTASDRAKKCWEKFHDLVEKIKVDANYFTPLTVRTLLEYNGTILRDNNFYDAWSLQKERETTAALVQFGDRIACIDAINDDGEKWEALAKGVAAGNMFDWGAKAIVDILENTTDFGLAQALNEIQQRPWFCDDLDKWIDRLKTRPYKKAVIFVDNAGVDFMLGVLPFVRQLLIQGTSIILAANSVPALNDVTFSNLEEYIKKAAQKCDIIKRAISSENLIGVENGQKGPCLDLRKITPELSQHLSDADLIMLEGMGRAIHTNFHAKFTIDSLKIAVLKNEWLAKHLGGQQFSVVFKYDTKV